MSKLYFENLVIPSADFGGESSLPPIKRLNLFTTEYKIDLDEDDELYLNYGRVTTAFPYRSQDMYERELSPTEYKTAVLENKYIKAVLMPDFGGKLWSLYDKVKGEELLFKNDVVRPYNLAVRNAWMSGGVEWNCGFFGHGPYTCSLINTAVTKLDDGTPVLRFYYLKRVRCVVVQMDFFLPEESKLLYARMRITNPNDEPIPIYWWSNIAACETDKSRVVVPATETYGIFDGVVTKYSVTDKITYPAKTLKSTDYFWKTKDDTRRYICQLDEDGYGLCQTSTNRLKGRKLFVWGNSQGGHRWMNFLTADDKEGRYSKIQCGLARTQYESLPMPPRAAWEWIEAYGLMQADAEKVHGTWNEARAEVEAVFDSMITAEALEKMLLDTKKMAKSPADEIIYSVDGWGALEILRREKSDIKVMNSHLDFGLTTKEQEAWKSLLENGSVGTYDTQSVPVSYMVQKEWKELLEKALLDKDRDNWYAHYQYGVMLLNDSDFENAQKHLMRSLELAESVWANYAMSVLCDLTGNENGEQEFMIKAYELGKGNVSLLKEVLRCLVKYKRGNDAISIFTAESEAVRNNKRCMFYYITALLQVGELEKAEDLLCGNGNYIIVPDIREGEVSLSQLWLDIQDSKKAAGLPYSDISQLPRELDFRMKAYDFTFTDHLIKALIDANVEPYFRLGTTIENNAPIKAYYTVPPKDYAKWARICEHVIMHYTEGWADGFEYDIKYWEIWNEPDVDWQMMWNGTDEEFYELYNVAATHLKARFPHLYIGGYASCGFYEIAPVEGRPVPDNEKYYMRFFEGFFAYIKEHNTPIDFFSWHSYSNTKRIAIMDKWLHNRLEELGYGHIETHLNEWNNYPSEFGTAHHSAEAAATMIAMQHGHTDVLCIYDMRNNTSPYCPLFNIITKKPIQAYYSMVAFNTLYKLGMQVESVCDTEDLYVLAASDGKCNAMMISNLTSEIQELNIDGVDLSDARLHIIDQERLLSWTADVSKIEPNAVVLIEW